MMFRQTKLASKWVIPMFFLVVLIGLATVEENALGGSPVPNIYYVHTALGNDRNGGLSLETAFATIHKGIDTASDGDVILVYPGVYQEEVGFMGKAIVVQGIAAGPAGVPVIQNPGDFAVSFISGEGPDSVLRNFVIRGSFMAVIVAGSSPTISNLTVVDNRYGIEAYSGSEPDIRNTIFWNNARGDIFGCQAQYSRVNDVGDSEGNIDGDPLFVDPNAGDYHLFSERGRYWPEHDIWVLDTMTSPCVDAGDPAAGLADEPVPNGRRINMGAYGGTVQASLSPSPPPLLPGQAIDPFPVDGATNVDTEIVLRWTAGTGALSHQVYFGTNVSPPLVSHQNGTEFDPGRLDLDTTYFWRIDEVNSTGKTTGALWSFTTINFIPKGRTCFTGETGVWVDGALSPISTAKSGMCIRRNNSATTAKSAPSLAKIEAVQEHEGVFECYDVILESGNHIAVAENHFFLAESGQWIALQNLTGGTRLQTARGSVGIVSISKRANPYIGKVYNLRIEGSDRYLVGKDAVIVRDY